MILPWGLKPLWGISSNLWWYYCLRNDTPHDHVFWSKTSQYGCLKDISGILHNVPVFFWNVHFSMKKRGLEFRNFVTFPNSLWTFRKSKKLVFHSVLGWSRKGCGHFVPPPVLATFQGLRAIRVNAHHTSDSRKSCQSFLFCSCLPRKLFSSDFLSIVSLMLTIFKFSWK